jgi:hypothetical protein
MDYGPTDPATDAVDSCLTLLSTAKTQLVATDGIGSELLPTIIGWEGDSVIGYAILHEAPPTPAHLYRTIAQAAGLMVTGWHATGLAISTEGYCAPANPFPEPDDNQHLAERYPTDPTVNEALWVAYADRLGNAAMGVLTFQQHVGRTVTYDEPVYTSPDQLADFDVKGTLPYVLRSAFTNLNPTPLPTNASLQGCREVIAEHIHQLGFTVYLDGSDYWTIPAQPPAP